MIELRRLTADAVLISLSLILFFVEGLLPPLILPPGAKFGLANVVTLAALYLLSEVDALIILLARIFLAGMFAGSPTVIFFSLSGGLLSLAAMIFMSSQKIFFYLPILGTCGIFIGVLIGFLSKEIFRHLPLESGYRAN